MKCLQYPASDPNISGLRRGCSSVVERHVANVNVEGSTPFARFIYPIPAGWGFLLPIPANHKS